MSDFKNNVIKFIQRVPKGKVMSYGQVAAFDGSPRAVRQVGQILKNLDISNTPLPGIHSSTTTPKKGSSFLGCSSEDVPWWRVINNQGVISIKGNWTATKELQKKLLEKEGVKINKNYTFDIEKYRWLGKSVSK